MSVSKRIFLWWWLGGLAAFCIVIYLHLPLITQSVPGGIGDHQSAPDAATVDAIQRAWRLDGLWQDAFIAMIADLVFIGIYGVGCVLGGLHFRAKGSVSIRLLGWIALIAGVVFLIADYGETIAQFIQMIKFAGDDALAQVSSTLRPIKMTSFGGASLALVVALIVARISTNDA